MERSASPILHEQQRVGLNDVNYVEDSEKDVSAGRYFHYNIKPTGTYDLQEQEDRLQPERTQRARAGKTLAKSKTSTSSSSSSSTEQPFLVQGDLRPPTSGSPISPSPSSTASSTALASATQAPHSARQNGNPDIQDIITGIVKLLNGNVNVHANTQGVRRPSASRINNRGPPRISEVQPLPIDYEAQKPGTSMRPPPYPFDRPERPFITGVPIPEQIVPVRPGFVSNRPPWYRNKPRPPITTSVNGSRRPLPQYQPLPAPPQQLPARPAHPEPEPVQAAEDARQPEQEPEPAGEAGIDAVQPTDTTYDSEFSNEDANAQYIEVSDQDTDAGIEVDDELQPPPEPAPTAPAKEHGAKKKHKPKPQAEKKHVDGYTTIIETSSVVNTVMGMSSSYVPMSMDSGEGHNHDLDPSTEEVIFMTANRTPGLDTSSTTTTTSSSISSSIQTMPLSEISAAVDAIAPTSNLPTTTSTSTTSTTTTSTTTTTTTTPSTTTTSTSTTTEQAPTANAPSAPPASYHPRPGIVLDDPEFKPGGRPRPAARPAAPQQPIQPTRQHLPPGYGEIFDVTLSAIQGPGPKGSGSKQTINIKPYGTYGAAAGGAAGQGDIIVSASGDEGFVSIDGKRTYINLFGDPTDPPAGATTPATRLPQLPGMATTGSASGATGGGGNGVTTAAGVGGAPNHGVTQSSGGYVVPETEIVELQPQPGQSQDRSKPSTGATTNSGPTRPHYRQRTTQPPVRIDTCIVGDDSTCDQAQHERCKTDNGVSSCHCRPGE